jgi:hypothetical protein
MTEDGDQSVLAWPQPRCIQPSGAVAKTIADNDRVGLSITQCRTVQHFSLLLCSGPPSRHLWW